MRLPDGESGNLCMRTRKYAVRIIRLYASLPKTTQAQVIGKQLLRSGTSVGAHVAESNRGKSAADSQARLTERCKSWRSRCIG